MALKFDIAANTRAAQAAVKDLWEKLTGVSDSLDDVARESDQAGDKLEDTFRDMVREAKKAEKAVDDIGDGGKKGFGKAGEASKEFKAEALSNLSEVTSSFDGSMTSIQDLAQGTLGGLAASLPGVGLVAAGAAVGVGLIGSAIGAAGEEQERVNELTAEWGQTYMEEGSRVLSLATILAKSQSILNDRYAEAETNSKNWGVSIDVAVAAMAGSGSAIEEVKGSLAGMQDALADRRGTEAAINAYGEVNATLVTQEQSIKNGRAALDLLTGTMSAGATQADIYSRIMIDAARSTEGATEAVDEFGDTVITLPDGKQVYIDAETGQATQDIDAIEQKKFQPKVVPVKVAVDSSAWDNWTPRAKAAQMAVHGPASGTWQ